MTEESHTQQLQLQITGMTCAACSARIEKVVRKIGGVHDVSVNLALGRAALVIEPEVINGEQIIERIEKLGYGAKKVKRFDEHKSELFELRTKCMFSLILTIPLFWAMARHYSFTSGIWVPELFLQPSFQWALATPIQFLIGSQFYFSAYRALKSKSANMDVLVVLSTTSAYFYSHYVTMHTLHSTVVNSHGVYFETSAMIITVVLLGKWLESSAKEHTLRTIGKLRGLQNESTIVVRGGIEVKLPVKEVQVGDIVVINSGDTVPVDGFVIEGNTTVDESLITGESAPVEKRTRDKLICGTRNINGQLKMKTTATGDRTVLAKMIRLMEEAQGSKPDIQRVVDKITAIFVPAVLLLAIATLCIWNFWLTPSDFGGALFKSMAILVIACPCALGLATPASILVGSGRASEAGILFKEGKHMEQLQQIQAILLDKTGTITRGTPRVTDIITEAGKERLFLRLMASAEKHSEHPFAKAIVKEAVMRGVHVDDPDSFEAISGLGLKARVSQHEIWIGSRKFMKQRGVPIEAQLENALRMEAEGRSLLYAAIDGRFAGLIAVADTIKTSTPKAIRRLKKLGKEVMMVTGDNRHTAEAIARKAGISVIHAEMSPEDKVKLVRRLQQKGRKVTMVGDGVNDAPALAAADIGIAVGTGMEIAKEAADVNLLHSDLNGVADAILLSQKTMRNIHQNLGFALLYNVLAIPLAFMGWLAPWIAGTAMALSSVTVVVNALRLQRTSWRL